ncbi:XylR family transcriptional regulator [Planctomicrobium sp. SH668]|uniref:XylR family transcriptional regulator n=1 Tax=Planctomicrobium sp. SH668 TaxID=3448126 RepID=UPI003F5BB2E9
MNRPLKIALLIETSREYGRGLLRGVMQYEREHGPWTIFFETRGLFDAPPSWLATWDGHGILARVSTPEIADSIRASGIPTIDLSGSEYSTDHPSVITSNRGMVKLGFDHLWNQGYRNFAFCALPRGMFNWSDYRVQIMAEFAQAANCSFSYYQPNVPIDGQLKWDRDEEQIAEWLLSLPKPVGLLATNDERALHVLEAARRLSLKVPEAVGIMGIDNDELLCNLANPTLSSVNCGVERVGYRAAVEMERILSGHPPIVGKTEIPPMGVVERQSTNLLMFDDEEMQKLVRELRANACDGLRVDQLLKQSSLSESTLQRRFRSLVGRSMKEEITRIRMDRARQLLAHTDLPISEIASRCGFNEPKQLSTVFHKKTGVTPQAYRKENRIAKFGGL